MSVTRLLDRPGTLPALCLATLISNAVIVVTGVAVRITGSGLGCPTWPKCTDASYVNTAEFGIHGYIEFGNRLLTFVLGLAIVLTIVPMTITAPAAVATARASHTSGTGTRNCRGPSPSRDRRHSAYAA